jgi:hypothetical protein
VSDTKAETMAEAALELWARVTLDRERSDVVRGRNGRSRMTQREAVRAAEYALIVLSTLARERKSSAGERQET